MDLPDSELSLRDSLDFVVNSPLGRKALACNEVGLAVFVSDLLEAVYRLVQACHLPEFTDHGLPHLCSLVDRVSRWELPPQQANQFLVEEIDSAEAARLLIAILLHDIGMLSQNPLDLPDTVSPLRSKSAAADVATWVRQTHVERLEKLAKRVLLNTACSSILSTPLFSEALCIAKAHQQWPWQWNDPNLEVGRNRGLASAVAVADILDEDSTRCDTSTLLNHREGNELNRAHWLRHTLTLERVLIRNGAIRVTFSRLDAASDPMRPVYSALRNHFRLVMLYEDDLKIISAPITNVELTPSTGVPMEIEQSLPCWRHLPGYPNENALSLQLLKSFMPVAILDADRCDENTLEMIKKVSLEQVDLSLLTHCRGNDEPRSDIEETFRAIVNSSGLNENGQ